MSTNKEKLYLECLAFGADSFRDAHVRHVRAWPEWAHDALQACTASKVDVGYDGIWPMSLYPSAFSFTPAHKHWTPFIVPSGAYIDLFVFESEIEDVMIRSGSGRTKISAAVCFPSEALVSLRDRVAAVTPKLELGKTCCMGFDVGQFTTPASRAVPADKPISDCWVRHFKVKAIELTLVEFLGDMTVIGDYSSRDDWRVLHTSELHAQT